MSRKVNAVLRALVTRLVTRLIEPAERMPAGQRLGWGVLLAGFCAAATLSAPAPDPVRGWDVWGLGLLVLSALAAPFAAVRPVEVLAATTLAPVAFYALGYASIFAPAPATAAVFLTVLHSRGAYAFSAALVICLGAYAAGLAHGLNPAAAARGPGWISAWLLAAAGAAEALRKRRQLLAQERQRARTAARRGAEQERLRIARELHDSLTHSISVVNVQASVAAHLLDREPDRIPDALAAIRQASGDALHELRSTVEVLRRLDSGAGPADEPGGSLARLPRLLDGYRAAGLGIRVQTPADQTPADAAPLPPEVDRATYRVVQEALNNAARYAPGSLVEVAVRRQRRSVTVTVHNGPAGTSAPTGGVRGGGQGLPGMRERVDMLGGRLHTGPCDDGGFRVHAELPLSATEEARP